jgi:hypothetical protein
MLSVRVTAAGAVLVCCLSFLTAPARACDDRFVKKCEKASAAAAAAEEASSEPAARRGSAKRVKVVASRTAKHSRFVKRTQTPRFASRSARRLVLASASERVVSLRSESPLTRRFRGFIDPQPIAQNAFEALRKPHVIALDFEAAAIVPPVDVADAPAAPAETAPPAAPNPTVATTPKQDKLAKPAQIELASAASRPVVLAEVPLAKAPVAKPVMAEAAAVAAPVIATEAPMPAPSPSPFPIHGLVLALCGALGAASALRFIVGA